MVANPARGSQLKQEKCFVSCPRSRLRIWSRETGSAVTSRVSPLILHTEADSGVYSRDSPTSSPLSVTASQSFNDWGGQGCHNFVSVLGGDGTKTAPPGDIFDQPGGKMN